MKKKTLKKKIAATVISAALLLQVTPAFATPTTYNATQYDNKIQTLENKIETYNTEIQN